MAVAVRQRTARRKGRPATSGSFKPGPDPRRNIGGRPKSFDQLRKLIQERFAEAVSGGEGATEVDHLILSMLRSKNPADRKLLLEYGFGKPREEIDLNAGPLSVKLVWPDGNSGSHSPDASSAAADDPQ